MTKFDVQLGERSYPIYIGKNIREEPTHLSRHVHGGTVFIISNDKVAPLYLDAILNNCRKYICHHLILPDGEIYKSLDTMNLIYSALLKNHCDRDTTLIALGGGVIGDITGFAAATYQRGVNFIQIPTTLLAQVDSSVGGKTGVNHVLGKNMIGAFYQPQCVIADLSTLNTLEDRELSAGIAEIIKYGLIGDAEFFVWLEHNINQLLARDSNALAYAVQVSCKNKAQIVAEDELEQTGKRALLNYGHTFGHAIETSAGYGNWIHGEAVACGMLMAASLSMKLGWATEQDYRRIAKLLEIAKLPTEPPEDMQATEFKNLMAIDKKTRSGTLHLVLLKGIGKAVLTSEFPAPLLEDVLREFCKL
ncbi:MAG: 3-dehydroquinate synthase [Gammaproteobacteria bacterium]|nr:3-dehydroquinate synthase [Gammaproteobacteria bacterium]